MSYRNRCDARRWAYICRVRKIWPQWEPFDWWGHNRKALGLRRSR